MNSRLSLGKQALALVFGNGAAQVVVAGIYLLTARGTDPGIYGTTVSAIGLGLAAAGFIDLGSNSYWIREIASGRLDRREIGTRTAMRLVVVVAIAVAVAVVSLLVAPAFIATAVVLVTFTVSQVALIPLRAARRAETVSWLVVLGRVVAFVVFFGQKLAGVSLSVALWTSLAIGDFLLAVCAYLVTYHGERLELRLRPFRNPWSGSGWYAVGALSTSAQQLDLPLLGVISGSTAAGIYGGVNRWIQPFLLVIGAFTAASAPFIAAEQRLRDLKGQLFRASWILVGAVALIVGVLVEAPRIVSVLLGEAFSESVPILRLLAVAMLLNTVTQPLLVTLQSRQYDRMAAVILAATVGTHLVLVLSFAGSLGPISAGLGVVGGQLVALVGTATCIGVIARRRIGR